MTSAAGAGLPGALGPGAEFDLIRRLVAGARPTEGVLLGPGDDAALLEGGWVVTCDMVVEDVHFRRAWLDDEDIGGRAVRAAVSDLAAMAARPVGVLLALAGSRAHHDDGTLARVGAGARTAVETLGACLVGGDVTRSPGPLVLDVVALGRTDAPARRSGARPGDDLWVTGALGGAAAAVVLWDRGARPEARLRARFARPEPRVGAAAALATTGRLHALMDLSDGLVGDAGHLAAASEVGIEVDVDTVPVEPEAARALGPVQALRLALGGGEDYELLAALTPGASPDDLARRTGVTMTRVGRVVAGEGVRFVDGAGQPVDVAGGWDHFGVGDGP